MSSATAPRTAAKPVDASSLRHRLAAVRARLRMVHLLRGVGGVIAVALLGILLAGWLDHRYVLPGLVRALFLVGTLVGVGLVALHALIRPLAERTDDLSLALKIEEHYPALNDCLASTVQFMDRGHDAPNGESEAMRRQSMRQTIQKSQNCDFQKIVDTRGLRPALFFSALAIAAVATLSSLYPVLAGTALLRFADPFGKHAWPTQTQLTIERPPARVAVNGPLEIKGTVRGAIPSEGKLVIAVEGFPLREQAVKIFKEREDEGRLTIKLTDSQVQRSFKFHVQVGDAVSDSYEVAVLPPPSLALLDGKLSPQVRLDFPSYTDLRSVSLPPGTGHVEGVSGTLVTLRGAADRPLKRVLVEFLPEPRQPPFHPHHLLTLGAIAPRNAIEGIVPLMLGPIARQTVEGVLGDDATRFQIVFRPLLGGEYFLHLEDDRGVRSSRPYELRLRPDPAPTVLMERPSAAKDLLVALPGAEIPVQVLAEDVTYGIRSVFLRYRTQRDSSPRRFVLYSEPLARRVIGTMTGNGIASQPPHYRPTRLEIRQPLALRRITHPDGSALKDGDTLYLQACADDFDDINPNKDPGSSLHEIEIKIVDRARLDNAIHQEQGRIQQEILRQREKQREVLKELQPIKNQADKGEKLTPDQQRSLAEIEKQQGVIQDRVGPTPKEGLRAEINKLLETLKQNGLENSVVRDRMADIGAELDRIAEKEFPKIQSALTEARKAQDRIENPQDRKESADKIRREAQAKRDRAEALGKNEPLVQEKAADKLDQEAREAENKGNLDKARELQGEAARQRREAKELGKNPVDPQTKETRDEIARLEQQARELKETADKLEQPPAQEPEAATKQNLADARKGQDEVERTLSDLLSRLEPWSSSREVKGEANKILQEQKELIEKARELDKQVVGKQPMALRPEQRSDLKNLAEEQQKLEGRVNQLLEKMEKVAEQRQEKDPATAKDLRTAREQAQKDNIAGKMQDARNDIEKNKLNEARNQQKSAAESLEKVVKNLEERREAELEQLIKKLREAEKDLEKLEEDIEKLRKKKMDAEKIADANQRADELKRVEQEQQRLQQKGKELGQRVAQLRAERGGRAMEQAAQKLEEAVKQLERRGTEEAKPEEALERIEEARQEVERVRQQAEEELAREQLVKVMDVLKRLKERQDALGEEAKSHQDAALRANGFTRTIRPQLQRLGDNQKGLGTETREVSTRDLDQAPVFARMVSRAAEAMDLAGDRAGAMAKAPAMAQLPPLPDEELTRWQALASRRLEQIIKAVQDEVDSPRAGQGGGGGGEGEQEGRKSAAGDHIPPLAQLKLLRVLEKDVRQQLTDFMKDHPDLTTLDDKGKTRYQSILKQRQDVRELFDELNKPADEPEAKPEPKAEPKPEGAKP